MVIGDSKTKAIADQPLLSWYHELFQETLLREGQRLAVIGYGFGDPHINGAIADGIRNIALKAAHSKSIGYRRIQRSPNVTF